MTYPIQPGPFSRATEIGEAAKHFLSQNDFIQDRHLTVCSSIAASASNHHEESHLIYGLLASVFLDQGFPVEYELDKFNTPHPGTTLCHPQNWLCRLRCKISLRHLGTPSLGNIFWRHSRFSPKQPEPQLTVTTFVSVLKHQTRLLLHYGEHISLNTFNNALT